MYKKNSRTEAKATITFHIFSDSRWAQSSNGKARKYTTSFISKMSSPSLEEQLKADSGLKLLYETTGHLLMKPKAYYKRIPGHPLSTKAWWDEYHKLQRQDARKKRENGDFISFLILFSFRLLF